MNNSWFGKGKILDGKGEAGEFIATPMLEMPKDLKESGFKIRAIMGSSDSFFSNDLNEPSEIRDMVVARILEWVFWRIRNVYSNDCQYGEGLDRERFKKGKSDSERFDIFARLVFDSLADKIKIDIKTKSEELGVIYNYSGPEGSVLDNLVHPVGEAILAFALRQVSDSRYMYFYINDDEGYAFKKTFGKEAAKAKLDNDLNKSLGCDSNVLVGKKFGKIRF